LQERHFLKIVLQLEQLASQGSLIQTVWEAEITYPAGQSVTHVAAWETYPVRQVQVALEDLELTGQVMQSVYWANPNDLELNFAAK